MSPVRPNAPILLFSDECSVCRRIGGWVARSAKSRSGDVTVDVRPIGSDPKALRALNPALDIWDAYATIHLLMPDGTMLLGGEAVGEVLRDLDNTKWFAWSFCLRILGFRPFQAILNAAYAILSDARPLLGCSGCGTPVFWIRPILAAVKWGKSLFGAAEKAGSSAHSTAVPRVKRATRPSSKSA